MKPSVIVWDLEIVPDISGFSVANDLVGKSDAEIREAIGEKFRSVRRQTPPSESCKLRRPRAGIALQSTIGNHYG